MTGAFAFLLAKPQPALYHRNMTQTIEWQNRIIEFGMKPADQFQANHANWRKHPTAQQKIMRQALGKVGWVGVVLENARTGNLIDGHERIWEALENGNAKVPYILVDLSPEEETFVLATFDTISHMAVTDSDQLAGLLKEIRAGDESLLELTDAIADELGLMPLEGFQADSNQPRLDQRTPIKCPACGHEFTN